MADSEEENKKRHRETPMDAGYYYNRKNTSESGHEFEIDDTEGNERIRQAHKDGTYFEMIAGGHMTTSVKGHEHKYNQGGLTCTVDNNSDVKHNGNLRLSIGKGMHAEINGVTTATISEELAVAVNKGASLVVLDDLYIVCKKLTIDATSDININTTGGDIGLNASGSINLKGKGISAQSSSVIKTQSTEGTEMKAKRIDFKSGG